MFVRCLIMTCSQSDCVVGEHCVKRCCIRAKDAHFYITLFYWQSDRENRDKEKNAEYPMINQVGCPS